MNLKITLFLGVYFVHLFLNAQDFNFAVKKIPDSLQTKANAVLRYCRNEIIIHDEKEIIQNFSKAITVLNEEGDHFVDAYTFYSNDSKISKIEAVIYNAQGFEIRKYKKKDFIDQSATSGFYSDHRVKYLRFTPRSYPYTVQFQYTFKTESTAFIPSWMPIEDYSISVQSKEVIVKNENNLHLKVTENNLENFSVQNLSSGTTIHYKLENQKAVKRESYSPSFNKIYPLVKFNLDKFTLKGYTSNAINNWKDFGKWIRNYLYESQLELSPETINTIRDLVKNETDPLKKAKLVYEFMQNKTRYVFVGIGIGGWQPTKASDVDRLGYGDCKGLSNYTKALLDAVGIESNWVILYANEKRDFDKDFNGLQGNHMILNLPKLNKGEDVWLECTSQSLPFGFLGDFTDDREVLVLEKEGGVLKHTPKYLDKNNKRQIVGVVNIDDNGNLSADLSIGSTGILYGDTYRIETHTKKELDKFYKSSRWYYNNNVSIDNVSFENKKDSRSFHENIQLRLGEYGTVLGEEMILRINAFSMFKASAKKETYRKLPLKIKSGFNQTDSLQIQLPENYSITRLPPQKIIKNKFGVYEILVSKIDDKTLKYTRHFYVKEGEYAKEDYNVYCDFIKEVKKYDNLKIAIKNKL
ncbi:DUF3857 domain-containing protein [Wenyingzhuangia sp. 1_MG-2023]|nr:DUF3857 domain-containing protein [Wenyingzhuangia sp. 1_MG-2023]